MVMRTFWCAALFAILLTTASPAAQQQPPQPPPDDQQEQDEPAGRGGARARERQPRPYDRVITRDAKSDDGVFTVHRIRDRIYYEIPKAQLGKEFLWVTQIAKTTSGQGQGGQAAGNRVVKWVRRENRVL